MINRFIDVVVCDGGGATQAPLRGAATTTTVSQAKKVVVERLIQPLQGQLSVIGSVCWRRFAAQWPAVVVVGKYFKKERRLSFFLSVVGSQRCIVT